MPIQILFLCERHLGTLLKVQHQRLILNFQMRPLGTCKLNVNIKDRVVCFLPKLFYCKS